MIQYRAVKLYDWNSIEKEQMNPAFARQVIHGDRMTTARVHLRKGAIVPLHEHPNEQMTVLLEGRLRFFSAAGEEIITAGQVMQIPGGVPHGVEALEDCLALDLFSPVREDWVRGDDAYLRSAAG
ncbi:MAG: cupin domain-containing protein [Acidobacteria bacterium]|nr:cupin domain-containing protein [Acidobacteriota bacterium]MBI3281435.1 cupin domain-containing protein [Acidobacteriota bacterium]